MNKTRTLSAVLPLVMAALLTCTTNHPPDVPDVPAGPDSCLKDSIYVFTAVANDPDGDDMALRFDWGDSTTSHWEGWFASGETVVFTHAWSDTGTYGVRVAAQDRQLTSESSEARTVQVFVRQPPDTPEEPHGPDIGGRDTSYDFQAGAGHPDWLRVAIRFAWGDGDTSDWSEFVPPYEPVEMSHSWSTPGTYMVRAQARDTFGLTSQWSEPHEIVIHPPLQGRLTMVGAPAVYPDGSGFLINIASTSPDTVFIDWLVYEEVLPGPAFFRDFRIDGNPGTGFPLQPPDPGIGPGDTVRFAPLAIGPDLTDLVEVFFADFRTTELQNSPLADVRGKQFVFRFSDGSEITVNP